MATTKKPPARSYALRLSGEFKINKAMGEKLDSGDGDVLQSLDVERLRVTAVTRKPDGKGSTRTTIVAKVDPKGTNSFQIAPAPASLFDEPNGDGSVTPIGKKPTSRRKSTGRKPR